MPSHHERTSRGQRRAGACDGDHQRRGALVAILSALGCAVAPRVATAAELEVASDMVAQGYELWSPWGTGALSRKRLTTTLSLSAFHLQGEAAPFEADYSVAMRLRLDADFGLSAATTDYVANPTAFLPGMEPARLDLMYGYVEGRNLAGGWFGFRAGRQYVSDVLGLWSFDGAMVRVTTPFFVQLEAYGGLEQRGGLPLSTARFEAQGVWRGAHGAIDGDTAADLPSYEFAAAAPAFGLALETNGPNWIHGRFDYRRVYNTAAAFTQQFASPAGGGLPIVEGTRLSQERFGYAASAFLTDIGGIEGGFVYDVHNALVSRAYGGLEFHAGPRVTMGGEVEYFVPTFDADSIWNWFTHSGVTTADLRVAVRPLSRLELTASAGTRLWMADGDPAEFGSQQCALIGISPERCSAEFGLDAAAHDASRQADLRATSVSPDLVARLGARYDWGSGRTAFDGSLQTGFGDDHVNRGRRLGANLSATQEIVSRQLWLGGTASVHEWHDPLRAVRDATSFGYVLWPEYAPAPFARMRVEWEHDVNAAVGHRFRVVGVVTMKTGVEP